MSFLPMSTMSVLKRKQMIDPSPPTNPRPAKRVAISSPIIRGLTSPLGTLNKLPLEIRFMIYDLVNSTNEREVDYLIDHRSTNQWDNIYTEVGDTLNLASTSRAISREVLGVVKVEEKTVTLRVEDPWKFLVNVAHNLATYPQTFGLHPAVAPSLPAGLAANVTRLHIELHVGYSQWFADALWGMMDVMDLGERLEEFSVTFFRLPGVPSHGTTASSCGVSGLDKVCRFWPKLRVPREIVVSEEGVITAFELISMRNIRFAEADRLRDMAQEAEAAEGADEEDAADADDDDDDDSVGDGDEMDVDE